MSRKFILSATTEIPAGRFALSGRFSVDGEEWQRAFTVQTEQHPRARGRIPVGSLHVGPSNVESENQRSETVEKTLWTEGKFGRWTEISSVSVPRRCECDRAEIEFRLGWKWRRRPMDNWKVISVTMLDSFSMPNRFDWTYLSMNFVWWPSIRKISFISNITAQNPGKNSTFDFRSTKRFSSIVQVAKEWTTP